MKCGIIYHTKTGHSRKIAKAIAQELDIEAQDVKSKPVMNDVDLLFITII